MRTSLPWTPLNGFCHSLVIDLRARERALLVSVAFRKASHHDAWSLTDIAAELRDLARSTGVEVVQEVTVAREIPTPGLSVGRGKAEEIHALADQSRADVIVFNHNLSSAQQRNLEEIFGIKVIDRTQLILDLFAQRAHSQEGKIQVALAQHQYLLPRLAGKGILLSRLGGGIGTRGPGEQKLETDRRRIRARITRLQRDLAAIRQRRGQIRRERVGRAIPTVVLVGYTHAGKSTLFNALTRSEAVVGDQLFTTLDPMSRRWVLPTRQTAVLSDTVGFLHELPHQLIEAFQATLEEVREAHLLLHVVDAGHSMREAQMASVEEVLRELGAAHKPRLVVFNKIDQVGDEHLRALQRRVPEAVCVSALRRTGLSALADRIAHQLSALLVPVTAIIPQGAQAWVHRVYQEGSVIERQDVVSGVRLDAIVPAHLKGLLAKAGFLALDNS